jgi:hypothetical protein
VHFTSTKTWFICLGLANARYIDKARPKQNRRDWFKMQYARETATQRLVFGLASGEGTFAELSKGTLVHNRYI